MRSFFSGKRVTGSAQWSNTMKYIHVCSIIWYDPVCQLYYREPHVCTLLKSSFILLYELYLSTLNSLKFKPIYSKPVLKLEHDRFKPVLKLKHNRFKPVSRGFFGLVSEFFLLQVVQLRHVVKLPERQPDQQVAADQDHCKY